MKLRFLLLFLLVIPIVRADGCGISCSSNDTGLLAFFMQLMCNTGTWMFCHPLSLFFVLVGIIGLCVFWYRTEEESRGKIKFYSKALFIILLLIIFFPTIKAFLFTSPFIPQDSCGIYDNSECVLSFDNSYTKNHTPTGSITTNYWKINSGETGSWVFSASNGIILNPLDVDCDQGSSCYFIATNFTTDVSYSVYANYLG